MFSIYAIPSGDYSRFLREQQNIEICSNVGSVLIAVVYGRLTSADLGNVAC